MDVESLLLLLLKRSSSDDGTTLASGSVDQKQKGRNWVRQAA